MLPAAGREGAAPVWPLDGESDRELVLWVAEWRRPQAVMWERNRQELEVALYVRSLVVAEKLEASTNSRTLVKQQQEALGISLPGLFRNRWRIEVVAERSAASSGPARSRLKVVPGGVGA